MNYKIINKGEARDVFVGKERAQFFIQRHEVFPTTNLDFAKEAAKLPNITYEVVEEKVSVSDEAPMRVLERVPDEEASIEPDGFIKKMLKKIAS